MKKLADLGWKINKVFTRATGIVLFCIGAVFLYEGLCSIDELAVRIMVVFLGLFFAAYGVFYYLKSKQVREDGTR